MLPPVAAQVDRLVSLGASAPLTAEELRIAAKALPDRPGLLVVAGAAPSALAPLLRRGEKAGFVVADLTDADDFAPLTDVAVPEAPVYLLEGLDRGDHLAGRSPDEAYPELARTGRTPLLLTEGVQWVLQDPGVLARKACFMTIGSRLRRPDGRLDARTPAVWISNGTGRDGRERRDAPKVGWCWAGNRHTWLGFASATARTA